VQQAAKAGKVLLDSWLGVPVHFNLKGKLDCKSLNWTRIFPNPANPYSSAFWNGLKVVELASQSPALLHQRVELGEECVPTWVPFKFR
jgi:hypothetical protein